MVELGELAPDFSLPDQNGNEIRSSGFSGKRVILSFHPLAWTSICARQMQALETNRKAFDALDAVALGISVDSVPCKRAWAESLGIKQTRLLADFWPHGEVAQMYDVFDGTKGYARRANIVIDEFQRVIFVEKYPTTTVPDMQDVLEILRAEEASRREEEQVPKF
ncbi:MULTISPECIES: redoxin domain-containing protein [unclassified Methanoculleus]|uniref:redoxin domain-containing protein n=1 Tax=unclassified Methanoculleus TaxID=2619537 RepID=UPI0025CEBBBD|nr:MULTISPECIES: redoxin domain-containing protein [unclassified Methanoculleus]MCK9317086.1 redoxin domain-containing protein [Methanoculleus sp.]MDD2253423.1 redoxin domain-containing protein [Methanoculleus sp.]MDD2787171.1 redoxin domain-containing protein [Methanoculleus sp.]MDD3214998.1 redoxin domain-containing protein [Methanoculleus sp.]MDD4313972.1 redoxin domain-containing protein [Methanoculleus sp.]